MGSASIRSPLRNLGLKLAALLLAVALLLHVKTEAREDHALTVPLRLTNLAPELVVAGVPPAEVSIRVRANGKELIRFRLAHPEVVLDLTEARAGVVFQRLLGPDDVQVPPSAGASVMEILNPKTVSLEVDQQVERDIRVLPVVTAAPAPGHVLRGQPEATPPQIGVRGPRASVEKLDFVRTRPIDLKSLDRPAELVAGLEDPGPGMSFSATEVKVRLTVEPLKQRVFKDVRVDVLYSKAIASASADPSGVTVTVLGPGGLVDVLDPRDITVRADARNLLSGKYTLLVAVVLPEPGLTVVSVAPDRCAVTLQ